MATDRVTSQHFNGTFFKATVLRIRKPAQRAHGTSSLFAGGVIFPHVAHELDHVDALEPRTDGCCHGSGGNPAAAGWSDRRLEPGGSGRLHDRLLALAGADPVFR